MQTRFISRLAAAALGACLPRAFDGRLPRRHPAAYDCRNPSAHRDNDRDPRHNYIGPDGNSHCPRHEDQHERRAGRLHRNRRGAGGPGEYRHCP